MIGPLLLALALLTGALVDTAFLEEPHERSRFRASPERLTTPLGFAYGREVWCEIVFQVPELVFCKFRLPTALR